VSDDDDDVLTTTEHDKLRDDRMFFSCENCGQRVFVGGELGRMEALGGDMLSVDGSCPACAWREGEPVRWSCPIPIGARVHWVQPKYLGTVELHFIGGDVVLVNFDKTKDGPTAREVPIGELEVVPRGGVPSPRDRNVQEIAAWLRTKTRRPDGTVDLEMLALVDGVLLGDWRKP